MQNNNNILKQNNEEINININETNENTEEIRLLKTITKNQKL